MPSVASPQFQPPARLRRALSARSATVLMRATVPSACAPWEAMYTTTSYCAPGSSRQFVKAQSVGTCP